MSELQASVVMDLQGNLQRQARRYEQSMQRMSTRGRRHMNRLKTAASSMGRGLDSLGNRWMALAGGVAGAGAVREVVNLEASLTRLGSSANVSSEEITKLKEEIFSVATETKVGTGEIIAAIDQVVERTGDMDFARANLETIAHALQSSGAQGQDIGGVMAELQKMGMTSDEVAQSLEVLTVQGEKGAFTLQRLAKEGPRVMSAYRSMGREGVPAIREMGAALQSMMKGIGKTEVTASSFEAVLREIVNPKKLKQLRRNDIKVFDQEALERGEEILRPLPDLMTEIIKATGGKKSALLQVFGPEASRAFNDIASSKEALQLLNDLQNTSGNTDRLTERSARNADTAAAALTNLYTQFQKFADDNLTDPINSMTDLVNSLNEQDWDKIVMAMKVTAGVLTTLYGVQKVMGGVSLARSAFGRRGGGGGAGDLVSGAADSMKPIPVYVVNKGFGGRGGKGGRGGVTPSGRGPTRTGHKVRRPSTAQLARRAPMRSLPALGARGMMLAGGQVGLAGLGGYGVGTLINEGLLESNSIGRSIGDQIGEAVAYALSPFSDTAARAVASNSGEARVRVQIDQDGQVVGATPERDEGGPEVDVDLGKNWTMP